MGCPRRSPSSRRGSARSSGRHGANVTPQLPSTTLVTPCQHLDVAIGSHASWASRWVWMSTKPGVTIAPAASMSRPLGSLIDGSMADDAIAGDRDVAAVWRRAGAVDDDASANHDVVAHSVRSQQAPPARSGRMTRLFDHATVGPAISGATCVTGLELELQHAFNCALSVVSRAPHCRSARTRRRGTPAAKPRYQAKPGPTPARRGRATARPAPIRARPAPSLRPVSSCSSTESSKPAGEAAAEREQAAVVAEHAHVATVRSGSLGRVGGGRGPFAP